MGRWRLTCHGAAAGPAAGVLALALAGQLTGILPPATPARAAADAPAWKGRIEERDGVPHLLSPAEPLYPPRTYRPEPLWSTGQEEHDEIFGSLVDVACDAAGNFYLLDGQMVTLRVYTASGELLAVVGRQGEGPGELQRPRSVLPLPGGRIGIADTSPGKIVRLNADGTPAGDLSLAALGPAGIRIRLQGARASADRVVIEAQTSRRQEEQLVREVSLLAIDPGGQRVATYAEHSSVLDFAHLSVSDRDESFDRGRWTVSPNGEIFALLSRDEYRIGVYAAGGELVRVIERTGFTPVPRTSEELDDLRGRVRFGRGGRPRDVAYDLAPDRPVIVALWPGPEGQLWVRTALYDKELPENVHERLEVFDDQGRFHHEARILTPHGGVGSDRHYLGELLFQLEDGGDGTADEAWEPLGNEEGTLPTVTCYRLVPVE